MIIKEPIQILDRLTSGDTFLLEDEEECLGCGRIRYQEGCWSHGARTFCSACSRAKLRHGQCQTCSGPLRLRAACSRCPRVGFVELMLRHPDGREKTAWFDPSESVRNGRGKETVGEWLKRTRNKCVMRVTAEGWFRGDPALSGFRFLGFKKCRRCKCQFPKYTHNSVFCRRCRAKKRSDVDKRSRKRVAWKRAEDICVLCRETMDGVCVCYLSERGIAHSRCVKRMARNGACSKCGFPLYKNGCRRC